MEIKVNVGDPKNKTTHTFTISEDDAHSVAGKKIGDTIRGELIGRAGYELMITGGSDNAGFPMRHDVEGQGKRRLLITKSIGNVKTEKGIRIRKTVAGNTVSELTSQLNVKVVKHGKDSLVQEEKPAEAPKEGKPAEAKKDAPTEKKEPSKDVEKKDESAKPPKEEKPAEKEAPEKPSKEEKPVEKEAPKEEKKSEEQKEPDKKEEPVKEPSKPVEEKKPE